MPNALEIDREAIKMSAVAGVPYRDLARRYGIREGTIRQWAMRGKWPVPARIVESARRTIRTTLKEQHAKGVTVTPELQKSPVTRVVNGFSEAQSGENATVTVSENLQELGQQGTLLASQLALRSLRRAPESLPVTSLAEVKTAMQVVRIAAGMDSGDGPTINLGLFGGGVSATSGAVVDIGGVVESDQDALDDAMFR